MVTVEIKTSGHGQSRWEKVDLTSEEIGELAVSKLRKSDASPKMDVVSVKVTAAIE